MNNEGLTAEILKAVSEIRDLVHLLAEPAIAARDQKLRAELRRIVGRSEPKVKAVFLMDGNHSQRQIHAKVGINEGNLSTFIKELTKAKLLANDSKEPRLLIILPGNFFESEQ